MSLVRRLLCVVLLTIGAIAPAAVAQSFPIQTHTLKNGMKILVQEDPSIPNVVLYTFFRIGSRNERPGTTGISHFFEHMMFNGAKKYGPGQFDRTMDAFGGNNNAYTSNNVTVYFDNFPSGAANLEKIFDLESDRIGHLSFDPKVIESERGVVASERRMSVDNSNSGLLNEQLMATAFVAHPYMWPVVGWMSDIQSWKMEDLQNHFRMGYAPNNATMVVVGDVKAEDIFRLAEKYIEPIPAHDPPAKVATVEPEQMGERRVVVRKPAQLPIVEIAYHVPQTNHPDYHALQVFQTILTSGQSSRLYRRMVDRDQLALSVDGGSDMNFDPGLFTFYVQPRNGVEPVQCEKALYEELQTIATAPVSPAELEKAKNTILAGFYREMKTIGGRANAIGTYEVFFGDYQKLFQTEQELQKVTAADVQRVAAKYFGANNRTVATLIPSAEEKAK
jgi:zinc protease